MMTDYNATIESLIWIKGVLDADEITAFEAQVSKRAKKSGKTMRNGNFESFDRYVVRIFTGDTSRIIKDVRAENVEAIKTLMAHFRSPDLEAIPCTIDGQVTEILGQERTVVGKRRAGNVSKPAA